MKSKHMFFCMITILSAIFFTSCVSENTPNENLVLKGTFSDEVVTLDPYFLARQKKAEQSFFGFSSSPSDSDSATDNEDDESQAPITQHSTVANRGNNQNAAFGGIEIIWPTAGTLTSLFGVRTLKRRTRMHTGIDIGAAKGTNIMSAADGQVLFAGKKSGYGSAVIISHDNSHETLYAHMSKISVRVGQFVTRNQLIGLVGKTGRVTGANLHFETRIHGVAYNPMVFLPPSSRLGKIRIQMKTPSYEDQKYYYENINRVAYHSNYK